MDIISTCPFCSDCEVIKDNKVYRCRLFIQMKGTDAAGDEHDTWNCSLAWQPILITEVAGAVRQTSASVQSMRNLQDARQKEAIQALENHNA